MSNVDRMPEIKARHADREPYRKDMMPYEVEDHDERAWLVGEIERLRARVAELEGREARLRKAAGAYRQCEMDYVFLAERPDEEYIAADVHQARMHMHMAATKLDAALAETAP